MCGERSGAGSALVSEYGSSPRVRGTLYRSCGQYNPKRFIPACAGNAPPPRLRKPNSPVHPRVSGQRAYFKNDSVGLLGSSPRVRATHETRCGPHPLRRFIPACAGNAAGRRCAWPASPVHPRVYGERARTLSLSCRVTGSSPRVRRTRHRHRPLQLLPRFIPACAGNAAPREVPAASVPVHPRVCGERSCGPFRRTS